MSAPGTGQWGRQGEEEEKESPARTKAVADPDTVQWENKPETGNAVVKGQPGVPDNSRAILYWYSGSPGYEGRP